MKIQLTFQNGETLVFDKGITIIEVARFYQQYMSYPILGCTIDNQITPMNEKLNRNTTIKFIDVTDVLGYKMYQAGLKFIFEVAIKESFGNDVNIYYEHSVAKGIIASIEGVDISDNITIIKENMAKIISRDIPFVRYQIDNKDAIKFFNREKSYEKANNVLNINAQTITLYKLDNYLNYYYTRMPYSTGVISKFDLKQLSNNKIVLLYPEEIKKNEVPEYIHYDKVVKCFENDKNWLKLLGAPYACNINQLIPELRIKDFIRTCELDFDNKIHDVVNEITNRDNVKFVLIAGPSSSGKTTTCKKLALNLQSRGLAPFCISVDDYFFNRNDTPKDPETGKPDYESLNAVDVKQFNEDLNNLLQGNAVDLPIYNFMTGEREYHHKEVRLKENSIVLIEGLHTLNNDLTPSIEDDYKYKVYLSPFIPLNIDRHNYVSTIDLRFLRRLARDYHTRNRDIDEIFSSWADVRIGELKYIFPYIHQADFVLNTALAYELGVLKVICEPLLLGVSIDSKYYEESRRLLDFLKIFYSINTEFVPDDSIIREFIGGSIFN